MQQWGKNISFLSKTNNTKKSVEPYQQQYCVKKYENVLKRKEKSHHLQITPHIFLITMHLYYIFFNM